jgi:hypothetical protein
VEARLGSRDAWETGVRIRGRFILGWVYGDRRAGEGVKEGRLRAAVTVKKASACYMKDIGSCRRS